MTTRMWEAVAATGRTDDLVAWVLANVPAGAAVYRSAGGGDRVVVIGRTAPPQPPPGLVARPPHAWDFERVPNPE